VVAVLVITPRTHVPGYALVLPALATVAILAGGGQRLGLATSPIRYVGKISYSLYLWHWPCIVLGATLPYGTTPLGKAGLVAVAGLLSAASYHFVEQPFRRRRPAVSLPRPGATRVVAPAYAMVLVVALAAAWVVTQPADARAPGHVGSTLSVPRAQDVPAEILAGLGREQWPDGLDSELVQAGAPEWLQDKCLDVSDKNAVRCTYGPPTANASVAVLGDSVAVSWLPALRRAPSLKTARIHVLTRRQCANLRGFVSASCTQHQDWALAQVRRLRPGIVVLSARYQGAQTPAEWEVGTLRMLTELAPYTRRIVVLAPPPDTANLQSCYTRLSAPRDCIEEVTYRWRSYAGAEQEATARRAVFVDPRPWFCAGDRCPALVGDVPVMFDGRHLAAVYAAVIAPLMSASLS
jgi:hypothetical protein